jgi:DNA-binding protein HU-beta
MTKQQLLAAVAREVGISQNAVRDVLDATFDVLVKELRSTRACILPGFVRFKIVDVPSRERRNPYTGGQITVPAHTRVKAFPVGAIKESADRG